MDLYEATKRRKSVRRYSGKRLSNDKLKRVQDYLTASKIFQPEVSAGAALVRDGKRFQEEITGVIADYGKVEAPHYIVLHSEDSERGYVEVGYRYEFTVLSLTADEIATCWIGKGFQDAELNDFVSLPEGQACRALISFGLPADTDSFEVITDPKRNPCDKFVINGGLEGAEEAVVKIVDCLRRAPSSINSQPWRVIVVEDAVHLYRRKRSGLTRRFVSSLSDMNRIDSGIGLCHLEVAGKRFWGDVDLRRLDRPDKDGMVYIGSLVRQ